MDYDQQTQLVEALNNAAMDAAEPVSLLDAGIMALQMGFTPTGDQVSASVARANAAAYGSYVANVFETDYSQNGLEGMEAVNEKMRLMEGWAETFADLIPVK